MWRTIILIFGVLVVIPHDTECQRFSSINDQFPFARARCVVQDGYGFLWFGTVDGLVKYDGMSIQVFRNTPGDSLSLPGQEILAITEYTDTTLLLGFQDRGLVLFNRNTSQSRPISLGGQDDRLSVQCLFVESENVVWIGTTDGLFAWDGNTTRHYRANPAMRRGLLNPIITEVFEDQDENLWIGTRSGIHRLDRNTESFENPKTNSSYPDQIIIDITEDRNNKLWVSVRLGPNRLYTWNQKEQIFSVEERFIRDGEFRMAFDDQNHLWASSRGRGVYRFTEDTETFFDPNEAWKHGFWGLGVFEILYDRYENIWVLGEEVFKWSGDRKGFQNIQSENSVVHSVHADDLHIWFCAKDPVRWHRKTGQSDRFLEGFSMVELRNPEPLRSHNRIYHIEDWGEDLIMSSTRNMIWWDRSTDRYTDLPTSAGGPLRDFVIDQDNTAWIAVNQRTPMRMQLPGGENERVTALRPAWTTHAVARSQDGTLWWGNRKEGLTSYNPLTEDLHNYTPDSERSDHSISSYTIHDILCHSNGSVWVGTKFGLDVIDPATRSVARQKFNSDQINTQITSILEGESGTLWLGTKNGLLYFDPSTDSLRRYCREDGLINSVYSERACYRDKHGALYFGGDEGIDYFHPDAIGSNPIAPDLYIKSASVNNKSVTRTVAGEHLKELTLSYLENFIEIELIGLHFASSHSVTYAYRLPGQSDAWIDLEKNRVITLARLPPGNYTLEARCASGDGIWSSPKKLLEIHIHPPFWRTSWFIALTSLALLTISYGLYQLRIKQIRQAEKVKAEFSKRIAEIEMKALRAQMNPHFLFNSLNSIRLLIDKGDNTNAKRYLTKYTQLVRQILNNSRKKLIRLDEELNTLQLYLELEKVRFKNFIYDIIVEEGLETDFIEIPPMLLQPYVENAIWHGLMHKQHGDKQLIIEVKRENNLVSVIIADNGIGRAQARKLNTRSTSKKESLGLRISEDRLANLKELYGTDLRVEIHDLQDPTGTQVEIGLVVD